MIDIGLHILFAALDEPLRLDLEGHRNAHGILRWVDLEPDVGHGTDANAAELDRGPGAQAAHRAVEVDQIGDALGEARLGHGVQTGEQREDRIGSGHLARLVDVRRVERDAAGEQRLQRLYRDIDAVGTERHVDAARVPEPAARPHQLIVRGVDEHFNDQALTVLRQVVAEYLTDADAAVVNGRAAADPAPAVGAQNELGPWHL